MREDLRGSAECQCHLYFQDLRSWVNDLHSAHLTVSTAFTSLLTEYGLVFPRSKLQLYPRSRPLHGPTALYWGEIVTLKVRSRAGRAESKRVIRHKSGPFEAEWAFTLAKRADLVARFLDFDRRRLALNAASRMVLSTINHLRNATIRRFPQDLTPVTVASGLEPDLRREVPAFPESLLPAGFPPRLSQYLRSGWIAAFTLALAEEECCELAFEIASNPSAEGLRLEITDRKDPRFSRQTRWVHTKSEATFPKLTDRLMRRLHLREGVRPVLSLKELKRRRIAKSLARSAGTFDSIRKRCEEAQRVVSAMLAEAKTILLPTDVRNRRSSMSDAS